MQISRIHAARYVIVFDAGRYFSLIYERRLSCRRNMGALLVTLILILNDAAPAAEGFLRYGAKLTR